MKEYCELKWERRYAPQGYSSARFLPMGMALCADDNIELRLFMFMQKVKWYL
jgi:hypothetical protein